MLVAGDSGSVLGWGGTFPSHSALSSEVARGAGAMLLNSGWHSPLEQDREAGGGAASAWFGCEINLEEKHSYPFE